MTARNVKRFSELFELLSRGRFSEKVDEHLEKSIEALENTPDQRGTSTITIQLTFTYVDGRVDVKPSVKSKLPEEKGFNGTPFWAVDGELSVQHPSQSEMFSGPRDATDRRETA